MAGRRPGVRLAGSIENTYAFIESYFNKHHIMPTQGQIATGCFLSSSTVYSHLKEMEQRGWIARDKYQQQSIVLKRMK